MQAAWAKAKARLDAERAASEQRVWELRGNNLAVQTLDDPEILLVGAAGTGKTLGILVKLDRLMRAHAGARALIVRKVRADLAQSTLVTFEHDVLGANNPICRGVQRASRDSYHYPNGSEVVVGGMDRPGRVLSAQYDFIYPAEAVQFTEEDWEFFTMRNRNYVVPVQQIVGDTNPDRPDHWLKQRCDAGLTRLLNTYHADNPKYWDGANWTAEGRDYVQGKLTRLSSVRKARYLDGKWVIAEGAVYEDWREDVHLIDAFPIPAAWRKIRVIDFGYTNPFVCLWIALDGDGRMYVYRQIYRAKRIVEDHADEILRLTAGLTREAWDAALAGIDKPELRLRKKLELERAGERIEATVADHDAEDRATLERHGIRTVKARKDISPGIQAVEARLRDAGDGKPRLFVLRGSLVDLDETLYDEKKPTSLETEMPSYVWPKGADGKPKKEAPVDADNHAEDALRYGVVYVDGIPKGRSRKNPLY